MVAGLKEIYISYAQWLNLSSTFYLDVCNLRQKIINCLRKPTSVAEQRTQPLEKYLI